MHSLYLLANDETLPDIAALETQNEFSIIYSADQEIGNINENRTNIHFNYLPDHLVNAFLPKMNVFLNILELT